MAAVAEPVGLQVALGADISQPVDNQGELFDREVTHLKGACTEKHKEQGSLMRQILVIVAFVAAVWVGVALSSFWLGFATCLLGEALLLNVYRHFRNSDYKDAAEALETQGFKQYIQTNNLTLSIHTIVAVHKQYKARLIAQLQQ